MPFPVPLDPTHRMKSVAPPADLDPVDVHGQQLNKIESYFGGLDQVDSQLDPESRTQLQAQLSVTSDPGEVKASAINKAYATFLNPAESDNIEANWGAIRSSVGKLVGVDKPDLTDTELYGAIGSHIKKVQAERVMAGDLSSQIQQAALEGDTDWMTIYRKFSDKAKGAEGYDPAHIDNYRQIAEASFNSVAAKAASYGPIVRKVSGLLADAKADANPVDNEEMAQRREEMIDELQKLNPEDRRNVLAFSAQKVAREQGGEFQGGGLEKAGVSFTRGLMQMGQGLRNQAGQLYDDVTQRFRADNETEFTSERRQIMREIGNAYNGVIDPVRGHNLLTQGLYNMAGMLPQLGVISSPEIGIPLLMADNVDRRQGQLEAQGVPTDKARVASFAQGSLDTAFNFITSNMVFGGPLNRMAGEAAGSGLELGMKIAKIAAIEGATLSAATVAQQISPHIVQELASAIDSDFPQADFGKAMADFKHSLPETIATVAPLMLIGTGIGAFREANKFADYTADLTNLKAVGFTEDQAVKISSVNDLPKRMETIREMFPQRQPGNETQKEAIATLDAGVQDQQNANRGVTATPMDNGGYVVTDANGALIDYTSTPGDAQKIIDSHNAANGGALPSDPLPAVADRIPIVPEVTSPNGPGFQPWFEGSRAVAADGAPQVVYRGEPKVRSGLRQGTDIYFTDDAANAKEYAGNEPGSNVTPYYLALKNPLVVDAAGAHWNPTIPEAITKAKAAGNDGVIVRNVVDNVSEDASRASTTYVAFSPEQVRTAGDQLPAVSDRPVSSAQSLGAVSGADAGAAVLKAWSGLSTSRRQFLNLVNTRQSKNAWATEFGAQENKADIYARQQATGVADDLARIMERKKRREADEEALTFMVESQRNRAKLGEWHYQLESARGTGLPFKWITKAKHALEHALENFDRIEQVARRYEATQDAHLAQQRAMGLNVGERSGYVFHAQDVPSGIDLPFADSGGGAGSGTPYKKAREYESYVDSILGGIKPKTLNAVTLMEMRLGKGQREINRQLWATAGRTIYDPTTAMPLVTDMTEGKPRIVDGKELPTSVAPRGYEPRQIGSSTIAVQKGYTGLYDALQQPSAFQNSTVGRAVLKANAFAKHATLFFDTFHLGRLAFHNLALRGSASYSKGLLMLDHTKADLEARFSRGEIGDGTPEFQRQYMQNKADLDTLIDKGLNVAAIGDNLHANIIHSIPGIGAYNKFLFDKFQRGAMVETSLLEYNRTRAMFPELSPEQAAARVARDMNARFGNLGKQSWIKSRTYQDLARLIFLAPGWNEGLIRSEIGAYSQLAETGVNLATNRRLVAGTLLRNVGALMVGQFIANQVINYGTRGIPTWENPEEGLGSKLSAWIPDVFGNGPGLFLNPFSLPAEITGQLLKRYESTEQVGQSLRDVASYKLSGIGRAALIFASRDDQGKHIFNDGDLVKSLGKALLPLPIQTGTVTKAIKSTRSGEVTENFPGEIEKQGLATFGVKAENAPSALQRIGHLAKEFKQVHGLEKDFIAGESDYSALKTALRVGNKDDEQEAMQELLKKRNRSEIVRYFNQQRNHPFTGSRQHDAQFIAGLDEEQRGTLKQARIDRNDLSARAIKLLASIPIDKTSKE
jgi:hypothetical protein